MILGFNAEKLAFDTMISEKLAIPESMTAFIEGRVPKKVAEDASFCFINW